MNARQFDIWIRQRLDLDGFLRQDYSANGLQVGHRVESIDKVAFAVDASLETFKRCAECNARLLVVHHGLFWGREQLLTGYHYERIRFLVENDIALYAIHLPLDADERLGNNYGIARSLGLENLEGFGRHKGKSIGVRGELPTAARLFEIQEKLFGYDGNVLRSLPFGPEKNKSVAIVTGGGASYIDQAIEQGIDLFITGDAEHIAYHRCLESGINVIFAGHYLTEVWGVKLLMEEFNRGPGVGEKIDSEFIDLPTGL